MIKTYTKVITLWYNVNVLIGGITYMELNSHKTYKAQMFNKGQSAKIFKEVVEEDSSVCVIRNSEPYVAILKYESYITLLKKANQYDKWEEQENAL